MKLKRAKQTCELSPVQTQENAKHSISTNIWRTYSTHIEHTTTKNQLQRIHHEKYIEYTIWQKFNRPDGDQTTYWSITTKIWWPKQKFQSFWDSQLIRYKWRIGFVNIIILKLFIILCLSYLVILDILLQQPYLKKRSKFTNRWFYYLKYTYYI